MTDSPRVRLYTTPWCGFCRAAKRLLDERGIPYEDIDVDGAERARVQAEYSWPTVPVVLIDGELVGGYTELEARDRAGGLADLA